MNAALLSLALLMPSRSPAPVRVLIETPLGDIVVELQPRRAPLTTGNFLRHVAAGAYDGGRFHRTVTPDNQPGNKVRIEVIQAGPHPDRTRWDESWKIVRSSMRFLSYHRPHFSRPNLPQTVAFCHGPKAPASG